MRKHSFCCLITVIYDLFRFIALTGFILLAAGTTGKGIILTSSSAQFDNIPLLLYAAPLALFPVMAFFLWQDIVVYRNFACLYIAGKVLSIIAAAVWLFYRLPAANLLMSVRFGNKRELLFLCIAPLCIFLDIVSVALVAAAVRKRDGGI